MRRTPVIPIRVRATDEWNASLEKNFSIEVIDLPEQGTLPTTPPAISLPSLARRKPTPQVPMRPVGINLRGSAGFISRRRRGCIIPS